jgi:hypothetical protein
MLFAILAVAVLVPLTVFTHYEVLRGLSILVPKLKTPPHSRVLVVVLGILFAHSVEIGFYALAYYLLVRYGVGTIGGEFSGTALDVLYFSATTYTTLGVGDLFPHGAIRLVVGVEGLNGFVLIGWSASFTYYAMQRFWDDHRKPHFLFGRGQGRASTP